MTALSSINLKKKTKCLAVQENKIFIKQKKYDKD